MKMEASHHEDEKMRVLYEASHKGCVSILNTLIQQDPRVLHKINSRTIITETPLHISALLGHLEFTKTLLSHCSQLALELDSYRSTPLHLASAQGHIDIVKELLLACGDSCLVRDQEQRIPLHYAVIRGRREVVRELIRAKPESLTFPDDKGKNILHLCVMYNHLEILKDLVALDTPDTNRLLTEGDLDGNNTILHLAIMLKHVETVRYLISIQRVRSEATKLKNEVGHSAADIVNRIPRDSKSLEIQSILTQHCGINFGYVSAAREEEKEHRSGGNTLTNFLQRMQDLIRSDGEWVQQMRANLSLVPTIVSTVTYQAAITPPGGFIQQGLRSGATTNNTLNYTTDYENWLYKEEPLGCLEYKEKVGNESYVLCPGDALLAYMNSDQFNIFIIYNTIAFVTSLFVAFLLLSGIPLKSKSMMWVLTLGMLSNLTFLLNAYFASIKLISPTQGLGTYDYNKTISIITWIFNACSILVAAFIVVVRLMGSNKKRNTSGS